MAIIDCPECGNMVSDKASNCIHCGTPIKIDKTVKIKVPYFRTGMMGNKASAVELHCNGKVLWSGISGGVVTFEIETETANVSLLVLKAYTGGLSFQNFTIDGTVAQGKRYEVKMTANAFLGNPAKASWTFAEVDFIDSGN